MHKDEKVANIIAFLSIFFGEDPEIFQTIMEFNPNYVIEKFERYVGSDKAQYHWGIHPALKSKRLDAYIKKWELELNE